MIRRIDDLNRTLARRRSAFTLLEVLVVVAIIVILATVSTIYIFGYLDGANVDTAQQQMQVLEKACKSYMLKSNGVPPGSLQEIVVPQNGKNPLVDGGERALMDPWGQPYQYNRDAVDAYNNPDPRVTTQYKGQTIQALGR